MQVLDLRPPAITVRFSKGSTLNPIFFYLGKDNSVIDMTGFSAHFQARLNPLSEPAILDLTLANGGLSIVTSTAETPQGLIPNAQGVQLNVHPADLSAITARNLVFGLEITSPSGVTTSLVTGTLEPFLDMVR